MSPAHAGRAAVLGSPIAHSLSPVLHRAAYAQLGLDWTYRAVEVDAAGLPAFLDGLGEEWTGLSLTMPLKEAVLPLLDEVGATAALTRAANTVLLRGGRRVGENTDVHGIAAAVRETGSGPFAEACIVGAGATARSAVVAAAELGAERVFIVARRPAAAERALQVAAARSLAAVAVPWDAAATALRSPLVLSTVPGDAGAALGPLVPAAPGLLLDATYRPWPTTLAAAWSDAGGAVVGGAVMLLHQAAAQVELMTGRAAPVAAMRQALEDALEVAADRA